VIAGQRSARRSDSNRQHASLARSPYVCIHPVRYVGRVLRILIALAQRERLSVIVARKAVDREQCKEVISQNKSVPSSLALPCDGARVPGRGVRHGDRRSRQHCHVPQYCGTREERLVKPSLRSSGVRRGAINRIPQHGFSGRAPTAWHRERRSAENTLTTDAPQVTILSWIQQRYSSVGAKPSGWTCARQLPLLWVTWASTHYWRVS
jgi:hypothetical protein